MKKSPGKGRSTKCFSISVPKELLPLIKEEARLQGRNVSSFLVWLIRRDQGKILLTKLDSVLVDNKE